MLQVQAQRGYNIVRFTKRLIARRQRRVPGARQPSVLHIGGGGKISLGVLPVARVQLLMWRVGAGVWPALNDAEYYCNTCRLDLFA